MLKEILAGIGAVTVLAVFAVGGVFTYTESEVSNWHCEVHNDTHENVGELEGGQCASAVYICRNVDNCVWEPGGESRFENDLTTNISMDELQRRIMERTVR